MLRNLTIGGVVVDIFDFPVLLLYLCSLHATNIIQKVSPLQGKQQIFSPVKQRILQFVDSLNISKREFYSKTGISRGTLESATGITEDTLTKVIVAYQNISPSWLITGYGDMVMEERATYSTIDLREKDVPLCKSCKEKDKTIAALEEAVSALKKVNRLENSQGKNSAGSDSQSEPYSKTA